MFITTDRRAYLLKLVSSADGKYVREVRFWYPDIIKNKWQEYNFEQATQKNADQKVAELPTIDATQLNFNYKLTFNGAKPVWTPQRVFDDGVHTYIQLSAEVASHDLPALFIQNSDTREIVNYRVKMPYFVVDKIFTKAVMISGVGRRQQVVTIIKGD